MEMFTTDITGKTYYHGFNSETAHYGINACKGGNMIFHEKIKLSEEYSEWLRKTNKAGNFTMPFNPETFLAFLETKDLIIDKKKLKAAVKNKLIINEHWFTDIEDLENALTEIDMIFEEAN